jgi:hypothetical protein
MQLNFKNWLVREDGGAGPAMQKLGQALAKDAAPELASILSRQLPETLANPVAKAATDAVNKAIQSNPALKQAPTNNSDNRKDVSYNTNLDQVTAFQKPGTQGIQPVKVQQQASQENGQNAAKPGQDAAAGVNQALNTFAGKFQAMLKNAIG